MSKITVRRATSRDWEIVKGIRLESVSVSPDAFGSSVSDIEAITLQEWHIRLDSGAWFILDADSAPRGMCRLGAYRYRGVRELGLYSMYVSPELRGTGAAHQLLSVAETWAKQNGFARIFLDVVEGNSRAEAFYVREGFRFTGDTLTFDNDSSRVLKVMNKPCTL